MPVVMLFRWAQEFELKSRTGHKINSQFISFN